MMRKHLSVRSETSSDVRPLVSIGGRTSTLILPGNKRRAYEKPTHHRSTVLCPPRTPAPPAPDSPRSLTGLQASIPGALAALVSG